jgi:uncharacterized membrane protein YphA (DoxX/SURF4 family)
MACKCNGASIGPIFLRIALGVIFLWAGLGKVIATSIVSGDDVKLLQEMGVTAKTATVQGATGTPAPAATDKMEVSNTYQIALMLKKYEKPAGDKQVQMWPKALTKNAWPVWAAYACTATELVGGMLLLVGGLTRLAAFGLASVMMTAMWLTVIGPAIASGKTHLGFLPADEPARATLLMGDFSMFQLQFVCFMMAMAVLCTGSGALGLDNVLFSKGGGKKPAKPAAEE